MDGANSVQFCTHYAPLTLLSAAPAVKQILTTPVGFVLRINCYYYKGYYHENVTVALG